MYDKFLYFILYRQSIFIQFIRSLQPFSKRVWLNDIDLKDIDHATKQMERIIGIYNTRRPHVAIGLSVPDQAHRDKKELFARGMY